ncbi:MAG: hypothetical protein HPY74_00435 [Firmicutes bacterium]|nr:hypothetical protein [Bacillota bacterium]
MVEIFNTHNKWYKGNLHTHTKLSDGLADPDECIEMYKNAGYSFLAITDHRKLYKGKTEKDFLLISGVEFDINDYDSRRAWHIVGIDLDDKTSIESILEPGGTELTPQYIVDSIIRNNGLAILAHPFWSLLTYKDIMELDGCLGIEIWNTVSDFMSNRGDSTCYIDVCASKGIYPHIFAADDTHFYSRDLFGGYIMVNSESLEKNYIIKNIKRGNFYSSQGPEIKQIYVSKDRIHVETSPVEFIAFMTDTFYCRDRIYRQENGLITEGTYIIKDTDRIVRVECKDAQERRAWSQIIPIGL